MKKFIPLLLFAFAASCDIPFFDDQIEGTYHDLSEDQRPIFKEGDTFYYYSEQTRLYDTMTISKIEYKYWSSDKKEYQKATIQYKNNNENILFSYSATKQCILNAEYTTDTLLTKYRIRTRFGNDENDIEIQINGKNYRAYNIDYYYSDNSSPSAPYYFTYSFKYGLLEFTYENGTVYRIVNPKF